jgi:hypothetical protein
MLGQIIISDDCEAVNLHSSTIVEVMEKGWDFSRVPPLFL